MIEMNNEQLELVYVREVDVALTCSERTFVITLISVRSSGPCHRYLKNVRYFSTLILEILSKNVESASCMKPIPPSILLILLFC